MKPGELPAKAFLHVTSAVFGARKLAARAKHLLGRDDRPPPPPRGRPTGKRNILFVTVDQQRFDAIGLNGGRIARTPVIDALGLMQRYAKAYPRIEPVRSTSCELPGE